MYLFFDTETADLPLRWDAPVEDVGNWPRIVQLTWVTCSAEGHPAPPQAYLIQPAGWTITRRAREVHGISTAYAAEHGVPLRPVLEGFAAAVRQAEQLVAHNIDFDASVVGAEFLRAGLENLLPKKRRRCTMKETTDYCRLPGRRGYKWPTLTELHEHLFGEPFAGAHSATADCLACLRCFLELRQRKALA